MLFRSRTQRQWPRATVFIGFLIGLAASLPTSALAQGDSFSGDDPYAGAPYAWQGNAGVNTANGNKLTSVPLVGWTVRGGLPIQFTLNHNSRGTYNLELGQKWTHSFDLKLTIDDLDGIAAIKWGNDLNYSFT